jgi:TfoX/Sxy family transcriptional regulator of competence genes
MAQPYLDDIEALLARFSLSRAGDTEITCKHFFSGAAAYADGAIFITLSPVGLALKLPWEDCAGLLERGAKPLKYFPKAPVKKGYVVLPDDLRGDPQAVALWISRSFDFVTS